MVHDSWLRVHDSWFRAIMVHGSRLMGHGGRENTQRENRRAQGHRELGGKTTEHTDRIQEKGCDDIAGNWTKKRMKRKWN